MNLAIASDEKYLHLALIAINSLFATTDGEIYIHFLANHVSEEGIKIIQDSIPKDRGKFFAYPIEDLEKMLGIEVPSSISITSYARLFIPSILPDSIDKVLYVDCDVLFADTIREFYNTNLEDSLVGGIQDLLLSSIYRKEIGISETEPYLNAGILLIPLNTWRKNDLQQKFLDYLLAHDGKVYHHDQGIINAVCAGRKTILPPRYNVISNYFTYPYKTLKKTSVLRYSEEQYNTACINPAIIHFTGIICGRPWESICNHPFKAPFLSYRTQTVFKDVPIKQVKLSAIGRVEKGAYRLLPFCGYVLLIKILLRLSHIKHKLQ